MAKNNQQPIETEGNGDTRKIVKSSGNKTGPSGGSGKSGGSKGGNDSGKGTSGGRGGGGRSSR